MRKLPVYLLLDCSGSMFGEPIEAVKNGVQVLVSTLRQDPYALETAHLGIITFGFHVFASEQGFYEFNASSHSFSSHENFGNEHFTSFESGAYDVHTSDETIVDDGSGSYATVDESLNFASYSADVTGYNAIGYGF